MDLFDWDFECSVVCSSYQTIKYVSGTNLESDVETLLLMETNVPFLRSAGELALIHAEGKNNFGALGHLWSGT